MATTSASVSVQDVQKHLRNFLSITSSPGPARTAKPPNWTILSFKDLTESPIFVLTHVPVARTAALDYFGLLILENANCFLFQLENPSTVVDIGEIDDAAAEISQTIHLLVRDKPELWLSTIFQWTLDTLAEVSRRNFNRRAVTNCTLSELLRIYTSNKSTKSALDLLNYCIGELLRISPEKCVASLIELSAKYGNACDWILTHIGTAYPKAIINQLLNCGLADFNGYINEMLGRQKSSTPMTLVQINQRQEQYSRDKLNSLAAILGHLARQQSTELRSCFNQLVEESLKPDAQTKDQYAIPLLFKLSNFSKDVAEILVKDVEHLVTLQNLRVASKVFSQIPFQFLFTDQSISNALINIILSLGESPLLMLIYEKLLNLTFGDLLSDDSGDLGKDKWKAGIRKGCQKTLDILLFNMEKVVHNQIAFSSEQLPVLQEIDRNLTKSVKCLFSKNEPESRHYFQLLTLLCFVKGAEKTAQLLATILFAANSSKQLNTFVCFCRIVAPFQPNVSEEMVVKLKFYHQQLMLNMLNDEIVDERQWLANFNQILSWERESSLKKELNFINLMEPILNNYCCFVEQLLPLTFGTAGDCVIEIFMSVGPPVHLLSGQVIRLISLITRLFYHSIMKIGEPDGLKFYLSVCDYILFFVNSQAPLALEILLKTLFAHAFADDEWRTIFCSKDDQLAMETNEMSEESIMLLIKNRSTSSKLAASTLIHSGTIGKGARKMLDTNRINETNLLRKLAFVRFLDRICLNKSSSSSSVSYNLDACRQMATRLVEHLCTDAISAEHCWDDWEFSKNNIQRYLTVIKQTNEIPFAWDLLSVVAEAYPCLWFCLPILKSILGSIMTQLEWAVDKNDKPPLKILNVLDKFFFIAKKGKILLEPFTFLYDICPHVSCYEAFIILSQIWLYLQENAPDITTLQQHFEYLQCDFGEKVDLIKGDAKKYLEPIRYVMQANIANVGYVYPKIFSVN